MHNLSLQKFKATKILLSQSFAKRIEPHLLGQPKIKKYLTKRQKNAEKHMNYL